MAVTKIVSGTTLSIEVQSGTDKAGDAIYSKKSFSNVRNDVAEQNAYDVAEAIIAVLDANTRNTALTVSSNLVNA